MVAGMKVKHGVGLANHLWNPLMNTVVMVTGMEVIHGIGLAQQS